MDTTLAGTQVNKTPVEVSSFYLDFKFKVLLIWIDESTDFFISVIIFILQFYYSFLWLPFFAFVLWFKYQNNNNNNFIIIIIIIIIIKFIVVIMIIMTIIIIKDVINFSITPQKVLKSFFIFIKRLRTFLNLVKLFTHIAGRVI